MAFQIGKEPHRLFSFKLLFGPCNLFCRLHYDSYYLKKNIYIITMYYDKRR